jgi:hypothetical protein
MHPPAGRQRGLLAGGQISPVHAEQSVTVVRIKQRLSVARPRRPEQIAGGRRPTQPLRCPAARTVPQPQRVERREGDPPPVGRQRGQMNPPNRPRPPRLPQVVLLDLVARPVHGQHTPEGDRVRLGRLLRSYEGEVAVHGEQQLALRRPAGRHGRDVPGDRDGFALDDERAGAVGCRGGPQIRQASPVRRERGGHDLRGRGLGVFHDDRPRALGGDGGDGPGLEAGAGGRGDALRPDEQDPLPVRRPGGVEVLPRPVLQRALLAGQTRHAGQAACAQVQYMDAVRAAGHRIAAALGGEGDTAAVGRPGRAAVVPGPVGALPYVRAVGPHRPDVEAAALVRAEGDEFAVRGVHGPVRFQARRGEGDGLATGARERPQHALDLGDQPVPAGSEGRRAVGGRGEGQRESGARQRGGGGDTHGGDGAGGARGREELTTGEREGEGGVAPVTVHDSARSRIFRRVSNSAILAKRAHR